LRSRAFFLGAVDINPFKIGSSYTVTVPFGATALFFGLPDANGFNGPSGFYGDNDGSFVVNVTAAVPVKSKTAVAFTARHHPPRKPLRKSRSEKRPTLNVQSAAISLSQWPTRAIVGANRRE
jgi:hypothetical protein